ncbi:TIGR04282 family arsenosugar biosynthesis glycosyltransferase [Hymenobacter fodinae]|uniref:TIGR04282 family arsenosugar biosynthesis glycosyltransferase n=1 Tax=Hymenobacter fodinae TaxID=2510796 RepID=UPI001FD8BB72|nr:TIGR04282 family arsenosugar biosynthesis glycosyltransferase [Hymenobacter fodinae]
MIVFARYPELGKVKTRLAAGVGPERALQVYRRLLAHTQAVTTDLPARKWLWLAEAGPTADQSDPWVGYQRRPQPPGDLGHRMQSAFSHAFAEGATAAVIIGTDCPGLTHEHLRDAYEALRTHEVVLGPATDGGYYLLGMKKVWPELFANKRWSTDSVRADTLADARRLGLQVHLLPELRDVDTADDLRAWETAEKRGS